MFELKEGKVIHIEGFSIKRGVDGIKVLLGEQFICHRADLDDAISWLLNQTSQYKPPVKSKKQAVAWNKERTKSVVLAKLKEFSIDNPANSLYPHVRGW